MLKLIAAAALAAGIAAAPAAAVTYDAFSSFTGVQGAGGFTYGSYDGTNFIAFSGSNGCSSLISGVICLADNGLPAVFKSTTGAHQSGTVIVPGDALILHPGPNAGQDAAVFFTAPTTGVYSVFVSAFVADNNPSGVDVIGAQSLFPDVTLTTLDGSHLSFSQTYSNFFLTAGEKVGIAINYDGVYYNDSTGLNFTVTGMGAAVPEAATWAMLIAGFGLTGAAMRRRRLAAIAA